MYGLPSDIDLGFFVGAMLTQVAIGQNEVNLAFDHDVHMMIQSDVRLTDVAGDQRSSEAAPSTGILIVPLLGRVVETAAPETPGTLKLSWNSGETLQIFDSSEHYESYTINGNSRIIIV